MIKQKFFKNSNSFRGNGGDFHAVFGVKDRSCGELGTNLLLRHTGNARFLSTREAALTTERSPSNKTKVDRLCLGIAEW